MYQKTDRWVKINEYVSKILKLPKNNITVGIEDSVEYLPKKFYKLDFENLRDSVRKIKQKARSKCLYSFCLIFFFLSFIPFFISSCFLSYSFFLYFFCSFIFFFLFISRLLCSLFRSVFHSSFFFLNRYVLLVILEEL